MSEPLVPEPLVKEPLLTLTGWLAEDADTDAAGRELAQTILSIHPEQLCIFLSGELGAGKTTLTKAICEALGVKDNISSPTFSIINEYADREQNPIYHFDFYRIEDPEEAVNIGTEDYFFSGHLCLVEWASRIENIIPDEFILVSLSIEGSNNRKLTISYG